MTIVNSVQAFDAELAAREPSAAYHGRTGCWCGTDCQCGARGTTTADPAAVTRIVEQMRAAIAAGTAAQITVAPGTFAAVDTDDDHLLDRLHRWPNRRGLLAGNERTAPEENPRGRPFTPDDQASHNRRVSAPVACRANVKSTCW